MALATMVAIDGLCAMHWGLENIDKKGTKVKPSARVRKTSGGAVIIDPTS